MTTSYEATKRWRKAHPEAAREFNREHAWNRNRRLGKPIRGRRGSYAEKKRLRELEKEVMAKRFNLRMMDGK